MLPSLPAFGPELLLGLGLIGLVVVACAYPRAVLLLGLVSLAVRPELLLGGEALSHAWGIQHTLLLAALVGCAWRYGFRREINWPVVAFSAAFALSLLLGERHPELTLQPMVGALGVLCLPWLFTQVALPPGSRRTCALVLALLPSLNVLVALLLQSPGLVYGLFDYKGFEGTYRLVGAEGDPGLLAILAFAGFAVALHESMRPGRPWAPLLATINLGIVVLTVTRMGILASLLLLATYAALSPTLRERILGRRGLLMLAGAVVLVLFAATLPSMLERVTSNQSWILSGGRDLIWPFYYQEFLASPIFGRGFGTGFLDLSRVPRKSPHNEYLHILVIGGVVGLVLCLAAIGAWLRQLLSSASPNDREFLLAAIPAIAMFAVTEDVLTLPGALALWAYLGTLLTRPGGAPLRREAGSGADDRDGVRLAAPRPAGAGPARPAWSGPEALAFQSAGPRLRGFERLGGDAVAVVPDDRAPGLYRAETAAPTTAGSIRFEPAEPDLAAGPRPVGDDAGDDPLLAAPRGMLARDRKSYWVKTFPTARRLVRTLGADKLVTLLLLSALASLAIGSSDIFGQELAGIGAISWHKLLLLSAAALMALYCGIRLLVNWPVVALIAILPINLIAAQRLDDLSFAMTARAFIGLSIPWLFVHFVIDRRARDYCCVALVMAPIVSALIGIAMDEWNVNRFGGATSAAFLGASGFFGFAIAIHEYSQRRHTIFLPLAFACLLMVIVSGTRMAWLSVLVFSSILYFRSAAFRQAIRDRYIILLPGLVCVIVVLAFYIPFMESRVFSFGMSNRDQIWEFFAYEIGRSALFGRGLGASEALRQQYGMAATHNEYIRILVDVGISGFVVFLAGIVAWFRQLLRLLPSENRAFVWAMIPCLALYGATDNILAMVAALAVFFYCGVIVDDRAEPADRRPDARDRPARWRPD